MTKLREIDVYHCLSLSADWLPESSKKSPDLVIRR